MPQIESHDWRMIPGRVPRMRGGSVDIEADPDNGGQVMLTVHRPDGSRAYGVYFTPEQAEAAAGALRDIAAELRDAAPPRLPMLPADLAGERAKVLLLADNATGGLWHARYSGGGTHEVLSHCGPGDTSVIAERLYEGDAVLLSNAKHTARLYAEALAELERVRGALSDLASEWSGEADSTHWNLPDDSAPENVALAHCRISEAHALNRCADALRSALAPAPEVKP